MKNGIEIYLPIFKKRWEEDICKLEAYKWDAVKTFQDNYRRIFDDNEDLYQVLTDAFKETDNLKYFAPIDSLTSNAKYSANDIREILGILFNEDLDLEYRVKIYRDRFREITLRNNQAGNFNGKIKSYIQDDRTIALLLALRYPSKYYLYISNIFEKATTILKSENSYRRHRTGDISNIISYTRFCNEVKSVILQDLDLLKLYKEFIEKNELTDFSEGNLLTQTFIYSVCTHLDKNDKTCECNSIKMVGRESLELLPLPKIIFKPSKNNIDYVKEASKQRSLGKWGEYYVVSTENKRLKVFGEKCIHKSIERGGDGYGYDILSYNDDGSERYIEVKTTKGDFNTPFYLSDRELEFSKQHKDNYYLYRVYDYSLENKTGKIAIIKGSMEEYANYPIQYRIALNEK
ncbi:MAG: DUF3883 domain-containing protein [Alistipes sp.]|nr:DUF3883 domain-containing protein [Alistipes sp.]